jgi:hypothetical protein
MALRGILEGSLSRSCSRLSLALSPGSDYAASLSARVTGHLIATARGSALYAVVAYYTTRKGWSSASKMTARVPLSLSLSPLLSFALFYGGSRRTVWSDRF